MFDWTKTQAMLTLLRTSVKQGDETADRGGSGESPDEERGGPGGHHGGDPPRKHDGEQGGQGPYRASETAASAVGRLARRRREFVCSEAREEQEKSRVAGDHEGHRGGIPCGSGTAHRRARRERENEEAGEDKTRSVRVVVSPIHM